MQMEMDRLSSLPDDLLIHILSRLDLEQAAKSSSLSERWRYLWTNFPSLDFKEQAEEIESVERFKARVHGVLASRRGAALDHLFFQFFYDKNLDSDIDTWVELATKNKVKRLSLHLEQRADSFDKYTMPEIIYSNPFSTLKLHHCIMPPPPSAVEWRSITRISLWSCILPQQLMDIITSACHALTYMELARCDGFNRLEIGCRSFRFLDVEFEGFLEISAQYMRHLDVYAFPQTGRLHLTNAVSLEQVMLLMKVYDEYSVSPEVINNAEQTFQSISCANNLSFDFDTIKAISRMGMHNLHLPQFKAEYMDIQMGDDVYSILTILESSPFLKQLELHICGDEQESTNWDLSTEFSLNCDLPHLKTVKIFICLYEDEDLAGESTFLLAKTLLKRAPFLERMDISIDNQSELPSLDKDLINTLQTLFSCPKSSEKATIVLH